MTPREFLALAEELIEGDTEAHWRSAVSRAYYAAFHFARLLMEKCGFRVPDSDRGHRHVSDRLNNSGHPAAGQAGLDLQDLRGYRNEADYDLWRRLSRKEADERVTKAQASSKPWKPSRRTPPPCPSSRRPCATTSAAAVT